jgi:hypothetical protein
MKHVCGNPKLADWGIDAFENIEQIFRDGLAEVVEHAFAEDDTYIYFPVQYSRDPEFGKKGSDGIFGEEVSDPLTVYLRIALAYDDDRPTYSFNLRDSIQDELNYCKEDGSYSFGLSRLSKALRGLADEIDAAVEEGKAAQLRDN